MGTRKPKAQTSRRMRELERRLRDAEQTIQAIRDGHVEALVVRTSEGEEIFTLRSADQPYRLMVEQMREGALTLSADGTILYCNHRFAELVAAPPERRRGRPLGGFLQPDDAPTLKRVLNSKSYRAEVQLVNAAGALNPAQLSS